MPIRNETMESKNKNPHGSRKNRRRSTRNVSINGDIDENKEKTGKRNRDSKDSDYDMNNDVDIYKEIINLVPAEQLNCAPAQHPAPPGTRVNLHGVILHETSGGLIVLNVRWRNRIFSGALIDVEKNKWASDKLKEHSCDDSKQFQAPPPIKKLKIPVCNTYAPDDSDSGSNRKKATSPTSSKPYKPSRSSKKRSNQEVVSPVPSEEQSPAKKNKLKGVTNGNTETLFECPEPNCRRKYKNKNGLINHQKTVHDTVRRNEAFDEDSKDKSDESDSGDDNFVIDEKPDEDEKDEEPEAKSPTTEEPNGSQSEDGDDEKKEELTENEKKIKRLKLQTMETLRYIKQENQASESNKRRDPKQDGEKNADDEKDMVKPPTEVKASDSTENVEVDVEMDKLPEVPPPVAVPTKKEEVEEKKPQESLVPTIQIETVSTSSEATDVQEPVVKTEEDHRKGSCHTIMHGDRLTSLNELFAPAQNYQQYSPTLSHLNPQTINDSLTDALSKHQTREVKSPSKDVVNTNTLNEITELAKNVLAPKPSLEIKRSEPEADRKPPNILKNKFDLMKNLELTGRIPGNEVVYASDGERSISPENMLTGCHKAYPHEECDDKTSKPNFMVPGSTMFMNPVVQSVLAQPQKVFENSLLFKELASKVSSAAVNMNSLQTKIPQSGFQLHDLVQIDPKNIPPQLLNLLQPSNFFSVDTKNPNGGEARSDNKVSSFEMKLGEGQSKTPLLDQRLLGPNIKPEIVAISSTGENPVYLPSHVSTGVAISRQLSAGESNVDAHLTEKLAANTFAINRDRSVSEKSKTQINSLRINPPITAGARPWLPNIEPGIEGQPTVLSKEYLTTPPVSASFRVPNTRTSSANSLHVYNPITTEKNPKVVLKRSVQPIPIAPAPTTIMNVPPSMVSIARSDATSSTEFTSPESDKEQPQSAMSRFTLTSGNLIPSPAENRGRPRKVRVVKTEQVPIGTAQEIARSRGPADTPLLRKHPTSPVVRASVIQGSTSATTMEGGIISKQAEPALRDRFTTFQHSRSYDAEEMERFAAAMRQDVNAAIDPRAAGKFKEYKGISSPPGLFMASRQNRSVLSPPTSAPPAMESLSRSSPGVNAELLSKAHYQTLLNPAEHRNLLEMHRSKAELMRGAPEGLRPPMERTSLSPREALALQNAFAREKDHRMEFHSQVRYPGPPRPDLAPNRTEPRTMFDRRTPTEESDAARLRERFLQTSPSMRRSDTVPPHSTAQGAALHSNNLVLGRADGAIIGPLSYDFHQTEHKR